MTALETDGVTIIERVVDEPLIASIRSFFDARAIGRPGARGIDLPSDVAKFISPCGCLGLLAASLAGHGMKPVRVLLFDKTPNSNWSVPWHQDRTIAVSRRHDVPGFGPWSVKDGVIHVEPPVAVLQDMLTLRVFVDNCGVDDGPLEVARRSHRLGRVPAPDAKGLAAESDIFVGIGCSADVLAMKLLAIHASKRAAHPSHRRVLHVDYASGDLPAPLEWAITSH